MNAPGIDTTDDALLCIDYAANGARTEYTHAQVVDECAFYCDIAKVDRAYCPAGPKSSLRSRLS